MSEIGVPNSPAAFPLCMAMLTWALITLGEVAASPWVSQTVNEFI